MALIGALLEKKAGADPAANAEFSLTVPTGKTWILHLVTVSLVQGITQTPLPFLVIDDGTDPLGEFPGSTTAQSASTTCRYTWSAGAVTTGQIGATTNVHSVGGLPESFVLSAGYRVRSVTSGIGANTDYGAPLAWVIES